MKARLGLFQLAFPFSEFMEDGCTTHLFLVASSAITQKPVSEMYSRQSVKLKMQSSSFHHFEETSNQRGSRVCQWNENSSDKSKMVKGGWSDGTIKPSF